MAAVEGAYQQQYRCGLPIPLSVLEPPRTIRSNLDPPLMERPTSALTRGVQITEFKDSRVNPEPVTLEESELLLEEYLSPRKLRDLTGIEKLEDVHYLEMKVDTRDTSLGNFGTHLPSLSQLKLSNSIISTVRDLGSSLNHLRVLWMARCGMEDLDGLSSMNNLHELYLAYNDLNDISACSLLENLQILDLEGNNIDELSQIHFLNTCSRLESLTLEGNPVCVTPSPDEASPGYDYRQAVKHAVPHLQYLDDDSLAHVDTGLRRTASVFDDDWALIDELMQDGTVAGSEDSMQSAGITTARPPTSTLRPSTGFRPASSLKNYTGTGLRPGTRAGRPGTSIRPTTGSLRPGTTRPGSGRSGGRPDSAGRPSSGEEIDGADDASELTRGVVVCGNPSKALRARQKTHSTDKSAAKILQQLKHKPEHTYDVCLEDDEDLKDLLNDLKQWRASHCRKQQEIAATKAPQVLKIDHDDTVSVSGDESLPSDDEDCRTCPTYSDGYSQRTNGFSISSGAHPEEESPTNTDVRPKSKSHGASSRIRRRSLKYDESFETMDESVLVHTPEEEVDRVAYRYSKGTKSRSTGEVRSPPSPSLYRHGDDSRPFSNPAPASKPRLTLGRPLDKTVPKVIDHLNPIIRASIHSPESRVPDGPRADTAKAALGQVSPVPLPPTRMRKGLANVQLLPSKFTK